MKIMRKLLCGAMAVMMLATCLVPTAFATEGTTKFSDVTSDKLYSEAVSTLNLMGIINGYEDGTFKPEQNVTRAEFTAMLMRTLNYGSIGSASASGLPFTDVDDNDTSINWAIPNINTAYGMGIINGYEDATFRPNANVAYEEAIKMIVCTLGYGAGVSVDLEPWYANFVAIAAQIGLTKNADDLGAVTTPASRACIAQLLFDALEIELVENGVKTTGTILSEYLGYIKSTGVISSNGITSFTQRDIKLRDNELYITAKEPNASSESTHTYSTTDTTLRDKLGYGIDFYYTDDGSGIRTLMFAVVNDATPLEINAADIEVSECSDSEIRYYASADAVKSTAARLETKTSVIYNGKLYGTDEDDSSFADVIDNDDIPSVGSLKLIDSDNNGKYDVIIIDSYTVYYVSAKSSTDYTVTDNVLVHGAEGNKITLNIDADKNLSIVNSTGSTVSFSSIATGNIICVAESMGSNPLRKAVVVTTKATGTVSAKGNDTITISGKVYKYSPVAPWLNGGEMEEPEVQDSGSYCLDINGDIVAYTKSESGVNVKYGYIIDYLIGSSKIDAEAKFRVLTDSSSTPVQIGTYKNTRINGEKCSTADAIETALLASGEKQYKDGANTTKADMQQLIKYTTTTYDGVLVFDEIITAEDADGTEKVETDFLGYLDSVEYTMKYNSSSTTLSGEGKTLKVASSILFSVPEVRTDYDDFKKSTARSSLKNNSEYIVEVFDANNNSPKVIVVHKAAQTAGAIDYSSPIYVMTSDITWADNDGDEMIKLENAYEVSIDGISIESPWISNESDSIAKGLEIGDVFRVAYDSDGYAKVIEEQLIFDVDGSTDFDGVRDENGVEIEDGIAALYDEECATIIGEVETRADGSITVCGLPFDEGDFSSAKILVYVEGDLEDSVKEETDITSAIEGLTPASESDNPSKILMFLEKGEVKLIYILPV